MTPNHLLLYRLAEIMLQQEQHVLPVDLLFDDAQIGEFVKSIQIDSPYQQLLLEGVLTESVREEKLYVSFSVEGYFHYVLGEVIHSQSDGKDINYFLSLFQNKLKGVAEGVENCLIRDVQVGISSRLIDLIDAGGSALDACVTPLASYFLFAPNRRREEEDTQKSHVSQVIDQLFSNPSDNDIEALEKTLEKLEDAQSFEKSHLIYVDLNGKLKPNSVKAAILLARSVKSLHKEQKVAQLHVLENTWSQFLENEELQTFFSSLGSQFKTLGDFQKSLQYYEFSLTLAQKLYGKNHLTTALAYSNVGSIWSETGDYDRAIANYTVSLEIRTTLFGADHISTAPGYSNVGAMWSKKGNLDKAIELYSKALDIRLRSKGSFHLDTALSYTNVGAIYSKTEELEQAKEYYNRSLAIRLSILGEKHLDTAVSLTNMGAVYSKLGDLDKALAYYERSLESRMLNLDNRHPDIALNLTNIGAIHSKKNDFEKALEYYKRSMDQRFETLGAEHDKTALSMINYGAVLAKVNRKDEALDYYQRALKVYIKIFGENHAKTIALQKKIAD